MPSVILLFPSTDVGNFLVAGVPAAARAAREVHSAANGTIEQVIIAAPAGFKPTSFCASEIARLAPTLAVSYSDSSRLAATEDALFLLGPEVVCSAGTFDLTNAKKHNSTPKEMDVEQSLIQLKKQGEAILMGTGKPTDGIVSRYLNRPTSRAMSRVLLHIEGVKPVHATIGAAIIGVIMAGCLLFGGYVGLMAGAVLFQLASIVDGVDGEIARATHRSSLAGAKLDSLTDAATNLAFIAGVSVNLWQRGYDQAAGAGLIGLAILTIGTVLLGMRARKAGGAFTFDAVKEHVRKKPSTLMQVLTWITMRDFYAAAAAVAILCGFAAEAMFVFAVVAAGWFTYVASVLIRTR